MITSPKKQNIYYSLFSLITVAAIILSAYHQLKEIHHRYWGGPGQHPQGTIYSVQTVEFNIANSTMPVALSRALLENDLEYIQDVTESASGLNGFIVTSCDNTSTRNHCKNEKVIAHTTLGYNWINEDTIPDFMSQSDYSVLTSQPDLGIEWRYHSPKDDTIVDYEFQRSGDVIVSMAIYSDPPLANKIDPPFIV